MSDAIAAPPVVRAELRRVEVGLRLPFEASHGTEQVRSVVVVRLERADGAIGIGECDALGHPTYTHEYSAGAFALLRDEVLPALLGPDPAAGRTAAAGLLRWHPMARAGVATALLDAELRAGARRLVELLEVSPPASGLERTAVLGRAPSTEVLLGWVDAALAGGAAVVKCKVAGPGDLATLGEVRRAFPRAALAADANGALDGSDVDELAAVLDRLGLRYLEQPFAAEDLFSSAELRRRCATAICLDESIGSLGAARVAHALDALDVINVKPARLGGIEEAVRVVRWAFAHGLGAFCGGMLELGVGRAAATAVAALVASAGTASALALPTDLGPSDAYVDADIAGPVRVDGAGRLVVPGGVGIGVDLRDEVLDAATVARVELERAGRR